MKKLSICGIIVCIISIVHAGEPMFLPGTEWNYVVKHVDDGPLARRTYGIRDTIVNGVEYQWICYHLMRSEGAKVWCVVDSMGHQVERLLYDFDMQVGDSIHQVYEHYDNLEFCCPDWIYTVTCVNTISLPDGRTARRLSYDSRPDDIEYVGSISGLLGPMVLTLPTNGIIEDFICCTRDGVVLYETGPNECDKLMNMVFTEEHTPVQVSFDGKLLRDGQLFIQHGVKTYNALGVPVK